MASCISTLPPEHVDANVHPTKSEVRLRYASQVFDSVRRAIATTLGGHARGAIRTYDAIARGLVAPVSALFDGSGGRRERRQTASRPGATAPNLHRWPAMGMGCSWSISTPRTSASRTKPSSRGRRASARASRFSCRKSSSSTPFAAPPWTARSRRCAKAAWRSSRSASGVSHRRDAVGIRRARLRSGRIPRRSERRAEAAQRARARLGVARVPFGDAAGERSAEEMTSLLERLQGCRNPMHCPHGRPTMVRLSPKRSRACSSVSEALGVLILAGSTASGKTELAIELAREFDAEIVGADSRQIYRGMPIGTAAPSAEQLAAVPHHLDRLPRSAERYSAARYANDALAAIHAHSPPRQTGDRCRRDGLLHPRAYGRRRTGAPLRRGVAGAARARGAAASAGISAWLARHGATHARAARLRRIGHISRAARSGDRLGAPAHCARVRRDALLRARDFCRCSSFSTCLGARSIGRIAQRTESDVGCGIARRGRAHRRARRRRERRRLPASLCISAGGPRSTNCAVASIERPGDTRAVSAPGFAANRRRFGCSPRRSRRKYGKSSAGLRSANDAAFHSRRCTGRKTISSILDCRIDVAADLSDRSLAWVCDRRGGIGADGLIAFEPSQRRRRSHADDQCRRQRSRDVRKRHSLRRALARRSRRGRSLSPSRRRRASCARRSSSARSGVSRSRRHGRDRRIADRSR